MKHSRSSLFLMELIIAILVFSLASAVCIRLFARSHLISSRTVDQNHAITQAQNLAECWYATQGDLTKMTEILSGSSLSEDVSCISLLFDQEWRPCAPGASGAVYSAELLTGEQDEKGLLTAKVTVLALDTQKSNADTVPSSNVGQEPSVLYTLDLTQHIAKRRGDL